MLESEKRVPESVIELLDGKGGADELTFEIPTNNGPEAGEGFTVMTEETFGELMPITATSARGNSRQPFVTRAFPFPG
jgi:hypothetical protein